MVRVMAGRCGKGLRLQAGAPCRVPSACQQGGLRPPRPPLRPLKLEACDFDAPDGRAGGEWPLDNWSFLVRSGSRQRLGLGRGVTHAVGQGEASGR